MGFYSRVLINSITVIVLCCFFFPPESAVVALGGNDTDQLALLSFKAQITHDPFHVLSSWNESLHFCQWHGVTCGRRHQRVTRLELNSSSLVGSLSPHIGNLSFLRTLSIRNNSFVGKIPKEVGHLLRLHFLYLHINSLSGEIPANLSSCSSLIHLLLGINRLVGKIPPELGSLSKLEILYMDKNNLSGDIPSSLANLSSLTQLYAIYNNLGGRIPVGMDRLKNLNIIALDNNRLSGTIPPSIFNISSLISLSVVMNELTGDLPSELGNTLPNLQDFSIGGNQFSGRIPFSILNASNLQVLQLYPNSLSGKVPPLGRLHNLSFLSLGSNNLGSKGADDDSIFFSSFINATNLNYFSLDINNFGGMLPESIGNFSTELETFSIAHNFVYGRIPSGIGNLNKLNWLNMWGNKFTGKIPAEIGRLENLQRLDLSNNSISGYIPSTLGNLSLLTQLNLKNNNIEGDIPSDLGKLQKLLILDLSNANLSGFIPQEIFSISSLSIYLDLSNNHFTGSLPIQVGNLKNLGVLSVSKNMLSGEIPSTIGGCTSLEKLYLENNFFNGSIPSSVNSLIAMQILDLSHNNLSGKIPKFFESLQLLDISYNDFEGAVPLKGIFINATAFSVKGNRKLCGGITELQLPRCTHGEHTKNRLTHNLKLVLPISLGLLGLCFALGCIFLFWCKKRRGKPSSENSGNDLLKVSYQSLHKATDGFSESKLIGTGSFSYVYEGILGEDGRKIAVKVLKISHRGAAKSFIAECEALRNIRHRNLVKVLSVCSSVDYKNNDFKALIYEFMANGNLDEWLHPARSEDEEPAKERKHLSLIHRLNIAIDVGCALDYLHHQCQSPIVHCDLKPSNVLLDDDMTAHVGDFGLVRILRDANYSGNATQSSSIGIRGSVGYAAPEYGMGNLVSISGDVYSFGILLLEMFTGRRPTDEMFMNNLNLHGYVKMALPVRVMDITDEVIVQHEGVWENTTGMTNMTSKHSTSTGLKKHDCLISIFETGILCSSELPSERLDISDAVAKLEAAKSNLVGGRRTSTATR